MGAIKLGRGRDTRRFGGEEGASSTAELPEDLGVDPAPCRLKGDSRGLSPAKGPEKVTEGPK